ncbi:hypothetical protein PHMEG_0008823 [Phytophthora megakarya]|uniref:CCHC-type domain-containing protein n=1 Tax=Phytophthora megakarya TaxID=4795 RepID=A0A225WHN0_9STRA|nr:hypothetical protein PHMEG_0008823 [Phytophthora megakarya]
MVERGANEVDAPEKLKDQILRLDRYNKCDRELGMLSGSAPATQTQYKGQKNKPQQQQGTASNSSNKPVDPEKTAASAAKKLDWKQRSCFKCHESGHIARDCPKGATEPPITLAKKQATYTRSVRTPMQTVEEKSAKKIRRVTELSTCNKDLSVDKSAEDYAVWEWCFDNAANVHMASDRTGYTAFNKDDGVSHVQIN